MNTKQMEMVVICKTWFLPRVLATFYCVCHKILNIKCSYPFLWIEFSHLWNKKITSKIMFKNSSCFKLSLRGLFCKPWERYERSLVSNWHFYGWKFSSFNKKFFQTRAMTLVEFQCQNISMSVRTDIKFLAWYGFQFTDVHYLFFYLC